jgi:DNA polymerase-3 subunit epsilon
MFGLLLICGIVGFLFVVIKCLIDKSAYKRKIARSDAELWSRVAEIVCSRNEENVSREYYKPATNELGKNASEEREPPPVRKHTKPELDKFLDVKRKTRIIILDVETNGLTSERSVLSCAAIKYEIDPITYEMTELERFHRYYYPVEPFNSEAIAVNRLTRDVITERRADATYAMHFAEDPDFQSFCGGVLRFIGHNISFDSQFIPFLGRKKKLCTMMANMDIVAVHFMKWKNEWKWPTLSETALHYGISFTNSDLHGSMKDAEIVAEIFMKMLHAARLG